MIAWRADGRPQRLDPDAAAGALPPDVRRASAARPWRAPCTSSRPRRVDDGVHHRCGLQRELCAVREHPRGIGKAAMIHNAATPGIEVDPETYEVRADGELLTCEPADVLPMAQRYFLF